MARSTNNISQNDFTVEDLGENCFDSPLDFSSRLSGDCRQRVLFNNVIKDGEKIDPTTLMSFETPIPFKKIHFDPLRTNVGIVTCGGLCPGLNDVIRSITYSALDEYKVKTVYGFRYGFSGLTTKHCHEALELNSSTIAHIHERGGTILGSSRGSQSIEDMVDTLVKFNISCLFIIGGDGTQHGSMEFAKEIKKRKLDISIMGIPKTIDNDISFVYKTFGFDTAVQEARKAIDNAHIEAKGAKNGIGLVRLMGRHSGFIATHATLASGNVNICLIPEKKIIMDDFLKKIKHRFSVNDHIVIVVAEGAGQNLFKGLEKKCDKSGNAKLCDIGVYLKDEIGKYLKNEDIEHTIKYIDPSYMIRSTPANATDSSFCLRLGNYAVHAAMAGKTNALIGHWNQNFTLVPIKLALGSRKQVDISGTMWQSIKEITVK